MLNNIFLLLDSEDLNQMTELHFSPEVFYSLVVMLLIVIFSFVIYFKFKKAIKNPLETPKGLVLILSLTVNKLDDFIYSIMGSKGLKLGGYFFGLVSYLFICFAFGLTGLASPFTYLVMPLSVALWTFILIHLTAMREQKWSYFKRYIDPFPIFLPINLITMWAPLLSLTLRLFGNALSGFSIMALVYAALEALSSDIFRPIFGITGGGISGADIIIAPIITPVLHLYFDLFSSFIQTLVFSMLTMIFISQEQVEDESSDVLKSIETVQN